MQISYIVAHIFFPLQWLHKSREWLLLAPHNAILHSEKKRGTSHSYVHIAACFNDRIEKKKKQRQK